MIQTFYSSICENAVRGVTSAGLPVIVVPKPGFSKKVAYFATACGSIHTEFAMGDRQYSVPEGVAHYLEHKLFDLPGRDVTEEFAALGANPNAFTSYDSTCYYFSCTDHFYESLDLLLEFVSTPHFTEESVKKEFGIIEQEIGMNEDSPESRVYENLMASMFTRHPIRHPILGTRESIGKITPEILYDCHRAYYHPENMVLCVVGDVDPERVMAAAEKIPFASGQPGKTLHDWGEEPVSPVPYVQDRMDVARPVYNIAFKSETVPDGEEGVLQEIVGDMAAEFLFGESSPLYLSMYEEGLIDNTFGGGFDALDGAAFLTCGGEGEGCLEIRDRLIQRAREICREGIDEEAFSRIKRSFLGRRIRSLDSFDTTCFRMCAYFMSKSDYFRFPEVYARLKREDILEFLHRVLRPERCCVSEILPEKEENIC